MEKNWSDEDLAKRIGRSAGHVRGIESGNQRGGPVPLNGFCTVFPEHAEQLREARAKLDSPRGATAEGQAEIDQHKLSQLRARRERPDGDAEILSGTWHACWQTREEGKPACHVEPILVTVPAKRRGRFEMRNEPGLGPDDSPPAIGSLRSIRWRADCWFSVDHWIRGMFCAEGQGPRLDGSFRLKLQPLHSAMCGMWLGVSDDSEQTCGLLVLARADREAERWLETLTAANPMLPVTVTH